MSKFKPVFWHQGMFIQPQHFQYSEAYQQSLLDPYRHYLHPYFWGVIDLELSRTALSNRSCEINSGEFVFEDGTHVSVPENAIISDRSFAEDVVDPEKPLTVYVGLRKLRFGQDNATVVSDSSRVVDVSTRFVTEADPKSVADLYQSGPDAQIQELNYKLEILFDTEADLLNEYHVIPVAQVVREGDKFEFNSEFIPPMIAINGSPLLFSLIKEIRDEITGRALQLDYSGSSDGGASEFDPNVLRYRFALQSLSQFVPRLTHLCDTQSIHPWDVYGLLRELVGSVSNFSTMVNMLGERPDGEKLVHPYDHTNLGRCFGSLRSLLTTLLNEITIGPQYMVEMRLEGEVYSADVPDNFFNQQVDYYLIVNTELAFEQWKESFEISSKLASSDSVVDLADRSLPGVPFTTINNPPIGLPKKTYAHYFRLSTSDEQWSKVRRQRNVALYWPEAPGDLSVELVILRK